MRLLCQVIEQTGNLTLLTDGERRYGGLLFELCSQALRTGKRGRPKKTLPKGVKVRLKNKGSQRYRRGPKRPKYQAPYPEHPDTAQPIATTEIHALHPGEVDDQATVAGTVPRRMVRPAPDGDQQIMLAGEGDGRHDVGHAEATGDERRTPIDIAVPHAAGLVVGRMACRNELAPQSIGILRNAA